MRRHEGRGISPRPTPLARRANSLPQRSTRRNLIARIFSRSYNAANMAALIDLGFCSPGLAGLERRRLAETQNAGCASKPSPENEPEAKSEKKGLRDAESDPIRPMSSQNAANQPKPRLASLPGVA